MTIIEAIKKILRQKNTPLTIKQIYEYILEKKLYAFSAKDPKSVVRGQIRKHCVGIEFPTANPVKHFILIGKNKYNLANKKQNKKSYKIQPNQSDKLPEEIIHNAYSSHIKLLDIILASNPAFFERLVIDLLLKMGYGENGSSKHRGMSGDGGIDGEILQDSLGFDRIYIQAKRYNDSSIGRPAIQQFVGALENITKGVFITTSSFTREATAYAKNQQQKTLVLIDGTKLTNLMIRYGVGIQQVETYTTLRIDKEYFSEN